MKKLFVLLICLVCSYMATAQTELTRKWTLGSVGDGVFCNDDGTQMLTWGGAGASLWDLVTGKLIRNFTGSASRISYFSAMVSKDFSILALAGLPPIYPEDARVKFFNIKTGEMLDSFLMPGSTLDVAFDINNDNSRVISGFVNGDIVVRDIVLQKNILSFNLNTDDPIKAVKFVHNSNNCVVVTTSGIVSIFDGDTGKDIAYLPASINDVGFPTFTSDGTRALFPYGRKQNGPHYPEMINTFDGKEIQLPNITDVVHPVHACFSNDGNRIAFAGHYNTDTPIVAIWDLKSGKLLHTSSSLCSLKYAIGTSSMSKMNIKFNETGDKLILTGLNGIAEIRDIATGKIITLNTQHLLFSYGTFVNGYNKVLTTGGEQIIKVWDTDDGRELGSFITASGGERIAYDISSDGKYMVFNIRYGFAAVVERKGGKLIKILNIAGPYYTDFISFCDNDKNLLVHCCDNQIKKVNIESGNILLEYSSDNSKDWDLTRLYVREFPNWACDESSDLFVIAYGSQTNVHRASDGQLLVSMKGHGQIGSVTDYLYWTKHVSFTKDKRLITAGNDRTLNIYSPYSDSVLHTLKPFDVYHELIGNEQQDKVLSFDHANKSIDIWNINKRVKVKKISIEKIYEAGGGDIFAGIGNNDSIIICSRSNKVYAWDYGSGIELWSYTLPTYINELTVSDKQDKVAFGMYNGEIKILDVKSGKFLCETKEHENKIIEIRFLDNDSTLLTVGIDGMMKHWDIVNKEKGSIQPNKENKVQLRFSNPVQNELSLFANYHLSDDAKYTIINSMGEKILSGALNVGIESHVISINNLSPGMYIFTTEINGKRVQEKFVVMR